MFEIGKKIIWVIGGLFVLGVNIAVFLFFGPPTYAMFRVDLWAMAGTVLVSYGILVITRGAVWAWVLKVAVSVLFMFYLMITGVNSLVVFAATIAAIDLAAAWKSFMESYGPW